MDPNQTMKPKTSAGDFLLNIGAIIFLYTIVSCLLNLIFTVIEKAYPKIVSGYDYYSGYSPSISWPVSMLIVLFPVFIVVMCFLEKSYHKDPEKRDLAVHKWLTYITLATGGVVLMGDLITVLYYFIDGQELTAGFLAKVFSVLVITSVVFLYYLADARNTLTPSKKKLWLGVSTIVVVGSVVWGFSVLGSPRTQQLFKYDQQKVSDLQNINSQVANFYSSNGLLPKTVEETYNGNYYVPKIDPQSQKPYQYQKMTDITYQLCAEFNKASNDKMSPASLYVDLYYGGTSTSWTHPAGHYCFTETINPNTYYNYNQNTNNYPKPLPPTQ
jgi:hypothetical protein